MAKLLNAFPEDKESQSRGRYPWDKWLDGRVWELHKGTREEVEAGTADFNVTTKSFTSAVKQAAKSKKGDVRTAPDGNKLTILFVPGESAEDTESGD